MSWTIQSESLFNCIFFTYFSYVCVMLSCYTLVVFSTERAYVVLFPLRARGGSRTKFFLFLIVVCVLFSIGINAIIPFATTRGIQSGNNAYGCFVDETNVVIFVVYYLVSSVFVFSLPTILLSTTNLIIISGLVRAGRRHRRLTVRGTNQHTQESSVGGSATATLLLVSLFQCVIYLPYSALGIAYTLVTIGLIPTPDSMTSLLFSYFFFMDATVYTRLINVFVYYFRIPFFRDSVNAIFCCCCGKQIYSIGSTQQTH